MTVPVSLLFILVSQVLFLGAGAYMYVVYFQTDKLVGGTLGIVTAVSAILVGVHRLLPSNLRDLVGSYIQSVFDNIGLWLLATIGIWIALIGWSYEMRSDMFGRLIYVRRIQEAIDRGALDRISLPNTAALASAFSTFPDRREVPVLLSRSSRLLYQAGRTDIFRSFQRSFFDQLDINSIVAKVCRQHARPARHDGLTFLTTIAAEAYWPKLSTSDPDYRSEVQTIVGKLGTLIALVQSCRKDVLDAQMQLIKLYDAINDMLESAGLPAAYDIEAELRKLEQALAGQNQQAILDFWQSHGAQDYLDLRAYLLIRHVKTQYDRDNKFEQSDEATAAIKQALKHFETLLLLRQGSVRLGDVIWSTPPFKLTLFYAFMLEANLDTLVWDDQIALFRHVPMVRQSMTEFANRKVFDEFRSARGWYAGTPLDFSLNGNALTDKINAWLKNDW